MRRAAARALGAAFALTAHGLSACATGPLGAPSACAAGREAMARRDHAAAIPHFDTCLSATSLPADRRSDMLHKRGRAHMKLGRHDAALADFAAARRHQPGHAGAHNSAAWVHYLRGEHPKAEPIARRARALAPDNVRVVDTHAHILAALGHRREALEAFFLTCEKLHSREGVAKLQRQLARIGYNPGPVTGTCTRKTRAVLAACVWHKCTIWK